MKLTAQHKKYLTTALTILGVLVGVSFAGVPVFGRRKGTGSGEFRYSKYWTIWPVVLKGESFTFDDYNFYTGSSLSSRVKTSDTLPFSKKKLTQMTIGEVKVYQARNRWNGPQLYATGRFQIIPPTLIGVTRRTGLTDKMMYNEKNQTIMADSLIDERTNLRNYLNGKVADTKENLQKAALDVAKIWSSVGVPYAVNGKSYNQSYYSKDRASVDTIAVQEALKKQRKLLA